MQMLAVDQLHLLLLLQAQLLVLLVLLLLLLQMVLLSLLLLLLQVETVQVIGLIGTRKYWQTSRIHTDVRLGLVVARVKAACPTNADRFPKAPLLPFCFFTPPTGSPLFFLCRVASCFLLLSNPQITAGSHSITHFSIENHFTHHSSRARNSHPR